MCWYSMGRNNCLINVKNAHTLVCFLWPQQSMQHHGLCLHHTRVKVVSGLVGQDNFVPSRRFREDGLEDLKLSTGGGHQILSAHPPWRNEGSLSIVYTLNQTEQCRCWRPCGALYALRTFFFTGLFHAHNTAQVGRFYLVLVCN